MTDLIHVADELTQAGSLAGIAVVVAIPAFGGIMFAEQMKKENDKFAPWLRHNSITTYRRFGYGFAIFSAVCAVASLVRYLSNT